MKKIALLVLCYGLFAGWVPAELTHDFDNPRFNTQRYEELGEQPGGLQRFTVKIRLESDMLEKGVYAWALRCDDDQGKLQWAFYRAGWNNNFGFYLDSKPKPIFVHVPLGTFANGLHSAAAVVTPREIKLYCDDKLLKTQPMAAAHFTFTTRPGRIFAGAADKNLTGGFSGRIEQVQVLKRAFNAKEVEYAFGTPRRPTVRVEKPPMPAIPVRGEGDFAPQSSRDKLTALQVVDWRFAPECSREEIEHSVKMLKDAGFDMLFVGGSFRYMFAEKYGDRNWWAAIPWRTYKETVNLLDGVCHENQLPLVLHLTANLGLLPDADREFAGMTLRELSDPKKVVAWKNYFGFPLCPNNPDFQEKYLARLRELFSAAPNLAGLMIDETTYGPGYTACGCRHCREKFLASYADKMPNPADKNVWHNFDSKLFRQWMIFRCNSTGEHVQRMEELVKNYGEEKVFTGCEYNPSEAHMQILHGFNPLRNPYNLLFYECEPCHPWDWRRIIAEGKYFASTQKELLLHAYGASISQSYFQQLMASVMNWSFQQWTEFNDFRFNPVNWFTFWRPLSFGKESMAQIALVVAPEDNTVSDYNYTHGDCPREYYGWAQALTEEHIPFDVIRTCDIKSLAGRYKLLVMPNAMSWSDEELDDLRQYLKQGGKAVATGKSFSLTPDGEAREPVKFKGDIRLITEFLGEKYHMPRIGAGWYGNGGSYFDERDPKAKEAMLKSAAFGKYSPISTRLPAEVIVNLYCQKYDQYGAVVVKLLNLTGTISHNKGYAVPGKKDYEFINYPTVEDNCSVTLRSKKKLTAAYMISPDFNEIVTCQVNDNGNGAYTVNFPLLARFGILYCPTENDLVKAMAPNAEYMDGTPRILPFDFRYISIR